MSLAEPQAFSAQPHAIVERKPRACSAQPRATFRRTFTSENSGRILISRLLLKNSFEKKMRYSVAAN